MSRDKFDYGIDLGTTNSAIAVMDNGQLRIIKSDRYQTDTTPSQVNFTKNAIRVGDDAKSDAHLLQEFKRTMGTDKVYQTQHMDHPCSSEQLSAEVLKHLKGFILEENIKAAVITVPNQFNQNQIDATQRAAELAGFQVCELLQEPIAASMAFGLEASSMTGVWLVFDFGGGTFDTALMKVDEGIMKVVDTAGDNHLGGKDLDTALVEHILIPTLSKDYKVEKLLADKSGEKLRRALKAAAQWIKISLSAKDVEDYCTDEPVCEDDDGEEIDLNFTVRLADYEEVVTPIFQKAIDISKDLLDRNKISMELLDSVLLVGGPTFSQTLRRMLSEQFDTKIDFSIDPMTSVARGAAIFAATKSIPEHLKERDSGKLQLKLKYPETTVETEENVGVILDRDKCVGSIPHDLSIQIRRIDGGWDSGLIGFEDAEIIELILKPSLPNVFEAVITDDTGNRVACQPSKFTIIQGLKAAKATLPHSICIDSIVSETGKQRLVALDGLEKNNSLPAKGKGVFRTQKIIRPGNVADTLKIPIIEGEPGEQAKLNSSAAIVNCSGENFSALLPEGSEVELTISIDESRRIKLSAYFPYTDDSYDIDVAKTLDTQEQEVDAQSILDGIKKARHALTFLDGLDIDAVEAELQALEKQLRAGLEDYDLKSKVLSNLNNILKRIDTLEEKAEWPETERRLRDAIENMKTTNEQYGDRETSQIAGELESNSSQIIQQRNLLMARDLIDQIGGFSFSLIRQETGLWIGYIKGFDEDFDSQQWTDRGKAEELINQAKQIIATQPSQQKLEQIVFMLFDLLPEKEKPVTSDTNSDLLMK